MGNEQRLKGGVCVGGLELELELELGRGKRRRENGRSDTMGRCGHTRLVRCTMSPKAQNRGLYLVPQTASI